MKRTNVQYEYTNLRIATETRPICNMVEHICLSSARNLYSRTSFIRPELPIAIALSHSDTITQRDPRSSINSVGQNATTQSFGNNPQEGPASWRKLEQEDRAVREYRHKERS